MKRIMAILMILASPLFCYSTTDFPNGLTVATEAEKANATVTPGAGDIYVAGTFEVDGASRFDGLITVTGAISTTANITSSAKRVVTPGTQTGITTSSQVVITSEFMILTPTGSITNTAAPLISTATATNPNGTTVILMGGSSDVLTVSDSAAFALGSATRALGLGDILELIIWDGIWYEIGFTNN